MPLSIFVLITAIRLQDKVIQKLKEVLTTKGMREAGFPAKVSLPLYLGVFAVVSFDNCRVYERGELDPELFLVNPEYESSRRMRKVVCYNPVRVCFCVYVLYP